MSMFHNEILTPLFQWPRDQDAFQWIKENFREYRKNHLIVLIAGATVSSEESSCSITDQIAQVESLYKTEDWRGVAAIVEQV